VKFRHVFSTAVGLLLSLGSAIAQTTLKDAFKDHFLIGVAVRPDQLTGDTALLRGQFNSLTPENAMKWEALHPRENEYRFEAADQIVAFGEKNGMAVIGHTLVWHSQAPAWLFKDTAGNPVGRDALLARMKDHIQTVVGRYKGRLKGWDVVNEALAEDGTLRDSPWRKIIGDDYIAKAFEYAHEADPAAQLYYNDYAIEGGPKRDGALKLLTRLKASGVPITGVGIQSHMNLNWPAIPILDETITAFGKAGLKVMMTELDIDVLPSRTHNISADVSRSEAADPALNPYAGGLPDAVQQSLARRYADLFRLYQKHREVVTRVTFWGLTDKDSWLNNFPIRGRTNHPLLFDRAGKPKPALNAVLSTAAAGK